MAKWVSVQSLKNFAKSTFKETLMLKHFPGQKMSELLSVNGDNELLRILTKSGKTKIMRETCLLLTAIQKI